MVSAADIREDFDRDDLLDELEDDIFGDAVSDEDGGVLQPLDSSRISISGALGGSGKDSGRAFSEINARETEVRFDALIDFLKNYWPEKHRTRILINGLVRLGIRFLNAPANRRQLRFEVEEAQGRYWMSRLGKEGKEHIEAADQLLDQWAGSDLTQINIRRRRIKNGLVSVQREAARYHTASRKKDLFEELATKLPSAAYEYFQCRLEQYRILRERAEDRARGIPTADFSDLIKRIQEGSAKPSEIASSLPWPILEALWVSMQDASPDNPHWNHTERMAASAAMANARRKRNRLGLSQGSGEDDDG